MLIPLAVFAGLGLCAFADEQEQEHYGVWSSRSGVRGMTDRTFTPEEITAHNRDQAAQGMRFTSAAPTPSGGPVGGFW